MYNVANSCAKGYYKSLDHYTTDMNRCSIPLTDPVIVPIHDSHWLQCVKMRFIGLQ